MWFGGLAYLGCQFTIIYLHDHIGLCFTSPTLVLGLHRVPLQPCVVVMSRDAPATLRLQVWSTDNAGGLEHGLGRFVGFGELHRVGFVHLHAQVDRLTCEIGRRIYTDST